MGICDKCHTFLCAELYGISHPSNFENASYIGNMSSTYLSPKLSAFQNGANVLFILYFNTIGNAVFALCNDEHLRVHDVIVDEWKALLSSWARHQITWSAMAAESNIAGLIINEHPQAAPPRWDSLSDSTSTSFPLVLSFLALHLEYWSGGRVAKTIKPSRCHHTGLVVRCMFYILL
jgi:hypothetical protein